MNEKEMYALAVNTETKGNKNAANKIYRKIINVFPDSEEARKSKEKCSGIGDESPEIVDKKSSVNKNSTNNDIIVTDIHMPFMSMVFFMVKWSIASIPAMIILSILFAIFWKFLTG